MRYISFDITDVDGINAFLAEHGDQLAPDSVSYQGGTLFRQRRICFLYSSDTVEDIETQLLISAAKKEINDARQRYITIETEIRYWHSRLLSGENVSEQLVESEKNRSNVTTRIRTAESVLKDLETKGWSGLLEATKAPSSLPDAQNRG